VEVPQLPAESITDSSRKEAASLRTGRGILYIVSAAIAILLIWEAIAYLDALASGGDTLKYIYGSRTRIPFPHRLLVEFVTAFPLLAYAAIPTVKYTVAGFLIGLVIGGAFAAFMWRYSVIETIFYPYVIASQMIPIIAIAPIIFYVSPNAALARIFTASYLTFFPVMVNFLRGLKSTDRLAVDLFEIYGATGRQEFMKLRVPSALPHLFTGMKLAAPFSVLAAIVVELMGSSDGLGSVILRASYYGVENAYRLWSAVLFSAFIAGVLYVAVDVTERCIASWQPELRKANP
jgi:NitT/TauT family transport system permease protein